MLFPKCKHIFFIECVVFVEELAWTDEQLRMKRMGWINEGGIEVEVRRVVVKNFISNGSMQFDPNLLKSH